MGSNQWIETLNRIKDLNPRVETMDRTNANRISHRIYESNPWNKPLNRTNQSKPWSESMNRIKEPNEWIESTSYQANTNTNSDSNDTNATTKMKRIKKLQKTQWKKAEVRSGVESVDFGAWCPKKRSGETRKETARKKQLNLLNPLNPRTLPPCFPPLSHPPPTDSTPVINTCQKPNFFRVLPWGRSHAETPSHSFAV